MQEIGMSVVELRMVSGKTLDLLGADLDWVAERVTARGFKGDFIVPLPKPHIVRGHKAG